MSMETTAQATRPLCSLERRVEFARRMARARNWEEGTQRDLAQLGIAPDAAQSLIDGRVLRTMDLDVYRDARHVIEVRKHMREWLSSDREVDPTPGEDDLFEATAEAIAGGSDPFYEKALLTARLASRGLAEPLLPWVMDREFWDSLDDAEALRDYLYSLPRTEVPQ